MTTVKWFPWPMVLLVCIAIISVIIFIPRTPTTVTTSDLGTFGDLVAVSPAENPTEPEPVVQDAPKFERPEHVDPITDEQWLGPKARRTLYSSPPLTFSGYTLELSEGRFVAYCFSDTSEPMNVRGRYTTDGDQLVLSYLNSNAKRILTIREIDGVTVLLSPQAVINDRRDGHPTTSTYGEFHVLRPTPIKDDNGAWWHELLQTHPKFAKWCRP